MSIKKIFQDLYMIKCGPANVFLIKSNDGLILIDAGYPKSFKEIIKSINSIDEDPKNIKHILITHCHPDHAGSLADIKELTNAATYMHPIGAEKAKKGKIMPDLTPSPGLRNKIIFKIFIADKIGIYRPVAIDHEITDGEVLRIAGGIKVIHTPGHCKGHLVYLWNNHGGILFAGDIASTMNGLDYMVGYNDIQEGINTLKNISSINFETACFAHGNPILKNASKIFKDKWG